MRAFIFLLWCAFAASAHATCSSVPFTFSPNTLAQSGQVNADFSAIVNCVNALDASQIVSGTINNSRLSAIPNTALQNSTVTIGSTAIALGGTASSFSNLSLANPTISGSNLWSGTGNFSVAQNLIFTNGSGTAINDLVANGSAYLQVRSGNNSADSYLTAAAFNFSTLSTAGSTTLCASLGAFVPAYNGITACSSDERLKNFIAPVQNGVATVDQFLPKEYSFKSDPTSVKHAHFFAQDMQPVAPECVTQNPDGFYSIEDSCVVSYLTKAVQELDARLVSHGL